MGPLLPFVGFKRGPRLAEVGGVSAVASGGRWKAQKNSAGEGWF